MRDIYDVQWKAKVDGRVENCEAFVYASSVQNAVSLVFCFDETGEPLRSPKPRAVRVDSESQLREGLKAGIRDSAVFVEDERDYIPINGHWHEKPNGDCFGQFLDTLLPVLRERWRQIENEKNFHRLQMTLPLGRIRKAVAK